MSAVSDYPLTRDAAEHGRLQQQAEFWAGDAALLFAQAGVRAGDRVADLGCGTLHIATQLASRVGREGVVRALDSDAALVRALRAGVAAPVAVECGDAYATGWPSASLDAVHARFLAAPAGRADALIGEMLRLLRPGGLVLLQEPAADSWTLPGAGAAWPRLLALIRAGFRCRGGDFDAGATIAERLRRAGARGIRRRTVAHRIGTSHPYARLPLAFCRSLTALWHEQGLAAPAELRELTAAIAAACDDPRGTTTTFTLVQAWGRRAAA